MPITPENIMRHEFIGLHVEVKDSSNQKLVGLEGTVVDETRDMITIETEDGEKDIQKDITEFIFTLPSGEKVAIDGEVINYRPEDRIKKKYDKW